MSLASNKENNSIQSRQAYNKKIIDRLRQKFRPLQQHKDQLFPHIVKSGSLHIGQGQRNIYKPKTSFYDIKLKVPQSFQLNPHHPLVDKAHNYIYESRKSPEKSECTKQGRNVDLEKYLKLLSDSEKNECEEQLKMKQEIQLFHQRQPYFVAPLDQDQGREKEEQFSFEKSRLMNAKIRQKLNHKKIIVMYR